MCPGQLHHNKQHGNENNSHCDAESLRFHGACKVAEQPNSATASAVVVVRTLRSG